MRFRWTKFDGSQHWEHDGIYLGNDAWGDWIGQRQGALSARPGRSFETSAPSVTLVPPSGDYAATFNAPPHKVRIYIDLAQDVRWSDTDPVEMRGIDMDLDVVHQLERGIWIDDIDEWEDHRVKYGYPAHTIAHLEALAAELEREVTAGNAPFNDATIAHWLGVLATFGDGRPTA